MSQNMTIRERMMTVYRNKLPDQIPVSIYKRYHRLGTVERMVRNTSLGILDFHPIVSLLAPPWHTYEGYVSEVKGADLNIKFTWENGRMVEVRTYETPVGVLSQHLSKDPVYGSDWVNEYYIKNIKDYKIMLYVVENTVFRKNEKNLVEKMKDLGEDGVVLGRVDRSPYQKLLIELAGPEQFLTDLLTSPDPVIELMEVIDAKLDEQFEMALESEVDLIWQPDNITSDMTPPNYYKKYCLPFYEKHGKQCKEAGKPYIVHMDGRTNALKDLIAKSPIDVIESFSFAEMSGDLPISEAKALWPDKVIIPNFPASLCGKSNEEIVNYLEKVLDEVRGNTPFMIQISEDIPPGSWKQVLPVLCEFMQTKGKLA